MDITSIVIAAAVIGVVGILVGILLGKASEIFKVQVNEKALEVRDVLPGNNCGACGFPGCDGLAEAIANGKAPVNACPVGGSVVADKVAEIVGGTAEEIVRKIAVVNCGGDCEKAADLYNYMGPRSCMAASSAPNGGPKACTFGCLGFGDCIRACEFCAISIINGIAYIDKEKCVSCGKCIDTCPRNIIKFVPYDKNHIIKCNSKDRGPAVKSVCETGCISCTLCVRNCPEAAITMEDNLPVIDYEKCTDCGTCKEKCPMKTIS